jgi:hypothetical protein
MPLIALYDTSPEVWGSLHMLYKDGETKRMCRQAMGKALNASASEVQRKIYNLRFQVFDCIYCMNEL